VLAGFDLLLPRAAAERLFRAVWPLLWIGPGVAAVLATARRLGGGRAVPIAALFLATALFAFVQLQPGRVDHHGLQIALAAVGLAGAVVGRRRGAIAAAVAAAVGLSVGVEALIFHALIGGAMALRWASDPSEAPAAKLYGAVLPAALLGLHLAQTAPGAWLTPACDMVGGNLLGAIAVGGAGLWASASFLSTRPIVWRLAALTAIGACAAGLYVAAEPACLGGPLGAADPRLTPVWLRYVDEVQTWPDMLALDPGEALVLIIPAAVGLLALGWTLSNASARRDPAWLTAGAFLLLATTAQLAASRMGAYAIWAALPVVAAAVARVSERWNGRLVPTAALAWIVSPMVTVTAASALADSLPSATPASPPDRCTNSASYRHLAALPSGVVLSEVYLGSHIVALTPHAVLAAPYHRMDRGILGAWDALAAPPDAARLRALNVRYVVSCPAHAGSSSQPQDPASLQQRLHAGQPPAWLEPVSAPGAPLTIHRVR